MYEHYIYVLFRKKTQEKNTNRERRITQQ